MLPLSEKSKDHLSLKAGLICPQLEFQQKNSDQLTVQMKSIAILSTIALTILSVVSGQAYDDSYGNSGIDGQEYGLGNSGVIGSGIDGNVEYGYGQEDYGRNIGYGSESINRGQNYGGVNNYGNKNYGNHKNYGFEKKFRCPVLKSKKGGLLKAIFQNVGNKNFICVYTRDLTISCNLEEGTESFCSNTRTGFETVFIFNRDQKFVLFE